MVIICDQSISNGASFVSGVDMDLKLVVVFVIGMACMANAYGKAIFLIVNHGL